MTVTDKNSLALAKFFHHGQYDLSGKEYWTHCDRVAQRLIEPTPIRRIMAHLHDTVEDTFATLEMLAALGVPREALYGIDILTHDSPSALYIDNIKRIISIGNRDVLVVKLGDNEDNSCPKRKLELPVEFHPRLAKRFEMYEISKQMLREALKI